MLSLANLLSEELYDFDKELKSLLMRILIMSVNLNMMEYLLV